MYTFSEDYLQKCEEKEKSGEDISINPLSCGKDTFRELIAYYIVKSSKSFKDYEEKVTKLEFRANELEERMTVIEEENSSLKESLNTVVEENLGLRVKCESISVAMNQQDRYVEGLADELAKLRQAHGDMAKAVKQNREKVLANERHTRGFCLRFNATKLKESPDEDTTEILTSAFVKVGLLNISIENSHRVGKKRDDGKGRQIIARFHSRPERNLVLKKRKELFLNHMQCFEDLCREDLDEKRKYAELMQEKFDHGAKVFFSRGKWFVNGAEYKP